MSGKLNILGVSYRVKCTNESCSKEENYFMLAIIPSKCASFCTSDPGPSPFSKWGLSSKCSYLRKPLSDSAPCPSEFERHQLESH